MSEEKNTHQRLKETGLFLLDILYNAAIIIILVVLIRSFLISPFRVVGSSMADTLHNKEFILIDKLSYFVGDVDRGDPIVFLPPIASRDNPKFENTVQTDENGLAQMTFEHLNSPKKTPYCTSSFLTHFWFCQAKAEMGDALYFAPQKRQTGTSIYQTEWDNLEKFTLSEEDIKKGYVEIKGEKNTLYTFRIYDPTGNEYFVKRVIGIPGDTIKINDGRVYLKKVNENSFTQLEEDFLNEENSGKTYIRTLKEDDEYVVPEGHYFVLGDNRNHSSDSRHWLEPITQKESPFVPKEHISGKVFIVLWPFSEIRLIESAKF